VEYTEAAEARVQVFADRVMGRRPPVRCCVQRHKPFIGRRSTRS